jgi:hypothetical protein
MVAACRTKEGREARSDMHKAKWEMARARELGKGSVEEVKQCSGQASSTVMNEQYKQSKSGLSGEVQSQAGTAPHRTGVGRQTYASAARTKTSGGATQTTAGDGRRGM